jgi:hypothetical protein
MPYHQRVSYHDHENLVHGLLDDGLDPKMKGIKEAPFLPLDAVAKSTLHWEYGDDLMAI